jgi:hypothetical protein
MTLGGKRPIVMTVEIIRKLGSGVASALVGQKDT